ncbi:MAG: bifunctional ADP-heptose synthase [Candidatus Obscuribacter sp.]|nr:bifunctional hydroxymethylpyrimidine kinase/phosphomethylpyrimidine kinase [Candidatus Melainabacteria bacterium]MDX1987468.1 bifunctional ADP-heptose synthase [Candidatus Obscuribacter sp.]
MVHSHNQKNSSDNSDELSPKTQAEEALLKANERLAPEAREPGSHKLSGNLQVEASGRGLKEESEKRAFLTRKIETGGLSRHIEPEKKDEIRTRKEFTLAGNDSDLNPSANPGLFFPIGLRQHFQLRKSEFEGEKSELRLNNLKPQITDLILETHITDDDKLTSAERAGLARARENLSNSLSPADALSNALHLARLYQHLRYIEEAKKSTLFALGIDPDNQLGKQLFKELERVHPTDLGVKSAVPMMSPLSRNRLKTRIINLSGGAVTVVGDLLIDRLLEGKPERISREAPVLILEHVSTEHIPGGAANTAHNVTALGGKCHAIGICGEDGFADSLAKCLEAHGITHDLVKDKTRPTTVKTRIISKSHSLMQQLLRIDRISHEPISRESEAALIEKINNAQNVETHAIILSDYKAGVITDGVIAAVKKMAKEKDLMVIVDAQGDFQRFQDCTLMTPNQPDAEAYAQMEINSREALEKLGEILLNKSGVKALLVTRGGEGMVLFQKGKPMFEIPAFNRSEVFDVTGAGDTVVATMALALTSGASMEEAMALGNLAASIVVRKPGTAVTSQKEMLEHLEKLNLPD